PQRVSVIMKKTSKLIQLAFCSLIVVMLFSFIACNEERVVPEGKVNDLKISFRTDGPVSLEIIKQKVADRDNIPIYQILTCIYYGQTTQGYWEYHLTTMFDGPKIYTITSIIGDVNDGF
ncbi:MAG: hypothetical protein WBP41_08615, partial [Saprospiraceae bacterium]